MAGRDSAYKFVFIISPASLGSEMCQAELEYAVAHGKPVISIALTPVDIATIPQPLAAIQAIPWKEVGRHEGFQRFVRAVEVDLDLQRSYTRLLTRAKEWESHACDPVYVLRGRDLAN